MTLSEDPAASTKLERYLRLIEHGGTSLTTASTTALETWVLFFGPITVKLPRARCLFRTNLSLQVKHTIASAAYGIFLAIYQNSDLSGPAATTLMLQQDLVLPSVAGAWDKLPPIGASFPAVAGIPDGTCYLAVVGKSHTAGTLTFGRNLGYEFVEWEQFGR